MLDFLLCILDKPFKSLTIGMGSDRIVVFYVTSLIIYILNFILNFAIISGSRVMNRQIIAKTFAGDLEGFENILLAALSNGFFKC